MYTITYAKGATAHDETHYQRRNVSAQGLAETIAIYQRRGYRIVRVVAQP